MTFAPARVLALAAALQLSVALEPRAQELRRGVIVDDVKCEGDPTQSYALYVPSAYSHDKLWSLLIAFHPGARGRLMVEKYQAAAEQYGYIVAGSNTSRNGPWSISAAAVQAMSADLGRRFAIDAQRIYLTGMSGGARVAMQVALGKSNNIAGVIASSAGYPDSQPRSSVPFAVFGTTGSEDFNYIEMRLLDRKLTSPHYLAVFNGGHTLPPDAVAIEAIEWMELQAMKSGRRTRDAALVERLFEKRQRAIAETTDAAELVHRLDALVADFKSLRDVTAETNRATDLAKQPDVKKALARERGTDDAEARLIGDIFDLEAALGDDSRHLAALSGLRDRLKKLSEKAAAADDTPERSQARRVLRAITSGASERVQDREYRALLEQYGSRGR
jgi:pimeloyl-ACP methyl ester carboxylesterase